MAESLLGDPGTAGYAVAAVAFFAFTVHLALGYRGGLKASLLLGIVAASAVWAALNAAFLATRMPALWSAQAFADLLRTGGWLVFMAVLLEGTGALRKATTAVAVLVGAAWVVYPAPPLEAFLGSAARTPYMLLIGVAVGGLVLTEQLFRRAREHARWGLKPLCLGLGAAFAFDLYLSADALLFGRLDPSVWAARGLVHALAIPCIALATVRNRDWTIDLAVSRGVILHSTAFVASGIYLLAVAAAGYYVRYFGGSWGKTLQVAFIFAALLLLGWLFSSGALRSKLRVFINKNFFSYRYDYREEWLRFTNLLAARDTSVSSAERSIRALANLVESPGGALWLRDGAQGGFAQQARWNMAPVRVTEPADGSLARFLATSGWVIDLRQYRAQAARYGSLQLPDWLRALPSAWLVVPIVLEDEPLGFVVLAEPRAAIDVNWEVLDLLKTAARQIGSFLAQVEASEALLEARKFESFSKMSAFVVHDLKNLVAQLSLLLANAERHRHNPRFQEDIFATVKHVQERMTRLLQQLSTGSRGDEPLKPVDLPALVRRVLAGKQAERRDIVLETVGAEPATLGYEQRLERVVGNLVQNAIDATRERGEVRVRVAAEGRTAVLEVIDSGCGMSEQFVRDQLFRPFQTTKGTGMGIGAYEAAQYAKDMAGRIEVESQPGAGTRMRLLLPAQPA